MLLSLSLSRFVAADEMAEKNKTVITLHDIECNALNHLIEFAYSGRITISEDNVQSLLPVASLLQVASVREACCKFLLNQLHPSNCLGIRNFADTHACSELHKFSHNYTLEKYVQCVMLPFETI